MTHIELHAIKFIRVYSLKGFFCPVLDFRKKIRVWSTGSETSKGLENCYSFNSLFQTTKLSFFPQIEFKRVKNMLYTDTHLKTVFTYFHQISPFHSIKAKMTEGFLRVSSTGFYRKN